jgi:membrane-associated phospholipid phosphatase
LSTGALGDALVRPGRVVVRLVFGQDRVQILGAGRSASAKTMLWSVAALVALVVGGSRIYLGAHWLTDVLGGYALGACWVATVVVVMLAISSRRTSGAELAVPGNESRQPADQMPIDEPGTGA